MREHQVLIVAGDTGSGKSTQLPQICLELGRGIDGLIAHTQPRRLAARALAARIAEELSQPVGASVGFRVRFADQVSGRHAAGADDRRPAARGTEFGSAAAPLRHGDRRRGA